MVYVFRVSTDWKTSEFWFNPLKKPDGKKPLNFCSGVMKWFKSIKIYILRWFLSGKWKNFAHAVRFSLLTKLVSLSLVLLLVLLEIGNFKFQNPLNFYKSLLKILWKTSEFSFWKSCRHPVRVAYFQHIPALAIKGRLTKK